MAKPSKPRLVFVHGIGGARDPDAERADWLRALASGAREAGHSRLVSTLVQDWAVESRFAYYADVFAPTQAQGGAESGLSAAESEIVVALLDEIIEAQLSGTGDQQDRRLLALREQLVPTGQPQGGGAQLRRLAHLCTALLNLPGFRQGAQWTSGRQFLAQISQVGRYLARGESEPHENGTTLDRRVRDRVRSELDPQRPAIVVAHSLGTVVALETLHEHPGPVPLFVTLGSPIATPALVLPRLRPQPVRTPAEVRRWLDFWDRDDIVVPKRSLPDSVRANADGVRPSSRPVDSQALWAHAATRYLARPEVAGPIAEAITELTESELR